MAPSPTPARAPALEARLLAALAAGDRSAALQWAERLVHRRGVEGLRQWLAHTLLPHQGAAAVTWLEAGLGLVPVPLAVPVPEPAAPVPEPAAVEPVPAPLDPAPVPHFSSSLPAPGPPASPAPIGDLASSPAPSGDQPAPAPASLRRLRSWLVDLPQAS